MLGPVDDGRQRRARDQLLDRLPEIPLAGARRLRSAVALAADAVPRRTVGRARGPLRLAQADPARHGAVHGVFAGVGRAVPHRYARSVALRDHSHGAWHGERAMGTAEPSAAARHRRYAAVAERRAPQRDCAPARPAGRTGDRRCVPAGAGADLRHPGECPVLSAADRAAVEARLRTAGRSRARAGAPSSRPFRHCGHHQGHSRPPDHRVDDPALGLRVAPRQQRLSGADAELRTGSRPWQRRILLWPLARGRCGWRAHGRPGARRQRLADAAAADRLPPGDDVVLPARRLRHDDGLPARAGAVVRRRLRRALLQFYDAGAGATEHARGDPRTRARALQRRRPGAAGLQRHHHRARRQPHRRALVARTERAAAARDHRAVAVAYAAGGHRGRRRLRPRPVILRCKTIDATA